MDTPTPLPRSEWQFPHPGETDKHGVVGVGADLEPATLIHAYRNGIFPMPVDDSDLIGWWSPPRRGVLDFGHLVISRSLRKSCHRYQVTVNAAFDRVIAKCAELPRQGGWISPEIVTAYQRLHDLGWAHSVETWLNGELMGGLYGVQVGGLFAGESMFHLATDASKVALVGLVAGLEDCGATLLDIQWATDHLVSLGASEIRRTDYLRRLETAVECQAAPLARLSGHNPFSGTAQYLVRTR